MNSNEIRKTFLDFFEKRGHKIVPSSSLIPDDPSVLLTTAGMQQFKPYYTGKADALRDFGSLNTVSVQKSFRTSDIDEVGDESHLTFFEMLGNFSFGGYFKKEAIQYAHEFITKELGLEIDYVSVFKGDFKLKLGQKISPDIESEKIWRSLGVQDVRKFGREDNFWGPTGAEGPCGPTTEIYINGVEIWNIVFNEYYGVEQDANWLIRNWNRMMEGRGHRNLALTKLETSGVDTGMGLERLAMVLQKKKNIFETDLFAPLLGLLPKDMPEREKRIITDHTRGAAFLLADGVRPSNKDRGYILRRLMRRVFVYESQAGIPSHVLDAIVHDIVHEYGEFYPELLKNSDTIRKEIQSERERFVIAEKRQLEEWRKLIIPKAQDEDSRRKLTQLFSELKKEKKASLGWGRPGLSGQVIDYHDFIKTFIVSGKEAFDLHQNTGVSLDLIIRIAQRFGLEVDEEGFRREEKKHQEISRAGAEAKFGGHGLLLDTGELKAADEEELKKVTRLHTATHLLNAALRKVLNDQNIRQNGSDITAERTRFDFSFPRKLTADEIKKIEDTVNEAVAKNMEVAREEMPYADAVASGALHFFREKYPERVSVYTVRDIKTGEVFSKELCGGPHVSHTGEIGNFKIMKEESSSAGVRRIRAVLFDKQIIS